MNACISECGKYRYWLRRSLSDKVLRRVLVVCMLNPSTADAVKNDRTIEAVMEFARLWGFTDIYVVNLYAYRSTNPAKLWRVADPVGPDNDEFIAMLAMQYGTVLCAWGANAPLDRQWEIAKLITDVGAKMYCLGLTKNGSPRHPLYIKRSTPAAEYEVIRREKEVHVVTNLYNTIDKLVA